jgi:hypothetical protein
VITGLHSVSDAIFYHGSSERIESFEPSSFGSYFSTDADYASGYVTKGGKGHGFLYSVKLSMANPLLLDGENREIWDNYTQRGYVPAEILASGHDGVFLKYADGEIEAMAFDAKQIAIVSVREVHAVADLPEERKVANAKTC